MRTPTRSVIPLTPAAVGAVLAYRRFASPLKGFACPHRLLHGKRSCSEHGLRVLRRAGWRAFGPLMRRRFAACRAAADRLSTQRRRKRGREFVPWNDRRREPWYERLRHCVPDCDRGGCHGGVRAGDGCLDCGGCDAPG